MLLPSLTMCLSIFNGCTVYYTTSEVSNKLKSTVDQVNTNLGQFSRQVSDMEKEYRTLPCDQKSEAFHVADNLLRDLNGDMLALEQLHETVNNDYTSFTQYTKGKSKIESGTEEWKKLKQTKAAMKCNVEALQNKGNSVVDEAKKFNTYVNVHVIPTVQVCEVKSYTSEFDKAITILGSSLQTARTDLRRYDADIASITAQFGTTATTTCNKLTTLAKEIRTDIDAMDPIHRNAQRILTDFKTKTKGLERIYSCNENWHLVAETETAIHMEEQDFQSHQQAIATATQSIQQLVNTLQK